MSFAKDLSLDGEYEMPSAEAMLAGTLALMTGHAQSVCARQRSLMAQKIVANLCQLAQHPALSTHFKAVADRMRPHWTVLSQTLEHAAAEPRSGSAAPQPLWHAVAARLQ